MLNDYSSGTTIGRHLIHFLLSHICVKIVIQPELLQC